MKKSYSSWQRVAKEPSGSDWLTNEQIMVVVTVRGKA